MVLYGIRQEKSSLSGLLFCEGSATERRELIT